ncbi:MAG: helix-turn-helix transcriptional regulator [Spirochaetales bacterium]|nr:helix-turn-helix transcriptional regulator [Spirochaetales bacterium]
MNLYFDPVFPFRIVSDAAELGRYSSFFRTFLLCRGPLFLLSNNEKRIIDGNSFIFLGPDPDDAGVASGRKYAFRTGKDAAGTGLIFNRHFLDQLLLSCWKNQDLQDFIANCWNQEHRPLIVPVPSVDLYRQYAARIESELHERPAACETSILQYLLRILILLYRDTRQTDEQSTSAAWQISDALRYIHENYAESFSLQEIADKYSFSPGYFSRIFREKTGLPLFEYINHIRIQKACIFLKRTTQPIIEIAFAVGYNNISFFNRYFRKITGMSPREYRNSIRR